MFFRPSIPRCENRHWHDFTLSLSLSLCERVSAQSLPTLPDSAYVKNEIIIWFQDGMLNPDYLGCYNPGVTSKTATSDDPFPLTPDFFYSSEVLSLLLSLGAEEAMKLVPGINPCADTLSTAKNGSIMRMPHFWNALVIRFSQDQNIPLLAYNLLVFNNSSVLWAQPNFIYTNLGGEGSDFIPKSSLLVGFPNDPLWGRNSFIHRSIPGCSYVDTAWTIEKGDSAIRVGVCDGGFNVLHEDLGGLPLGQNQRFRDGWDYEELFLGPNIAPRNQGTVHGTLVAGVLGATSDNTIGLPGIAGGDDSLQHPGVSLYGLVANDTKSMSAAIWEGAARSGTTPARDIHGAVLGSGKRWECDILNFCVNSGMLYLDMTGVGGAADEILRAMMAFSYQNGVASFAAMGDNANIREHLMDGHDSVFCMYPQDVDQEWVVSVGNNPNQQITNPYDWGKNLDILATAGGWTTSFTYPNGPYGYTTLHQTSGATPVVSGVAGLLLSLHKRMYPRRTASGYDSIPRVLYPDDMEWLLKHSAQPADPLHPHDYLTGWGVINATSTLRKLNYPFVLRHFSGPYTGAVIDTGDFDTLSIVFPGWNLQASYNPLFNGDNTYRVKRYHLIQRVEYGEAFPRVERAWGRGGNSLTGYGWPLKLRKSPFRLPLYRVGYCNLAEEDAFDSVGCVLETNVYEAWKIDLHNPGASPQYAGWFPCEPLQVVFTGSVLARIDPTVTGIDRIPLPASFHVTGPYPNPTTGAAYIVVSVPNGAKVCLNVFDVLGRQLAPNTVMRQYDAGEHIVQIPAGCNGAIFVQVITPEGSTVLKKLNIVR
jgi:subtilisin family serine protease